jgi:short-subunit dehydrogenase
VELKGKVFVITGGGNGIGRELVLELLSRGAEIAVVDKNKSFLEETMRMSRDKKEKLSIYQVDISDKQAVETLPELILSEHCAVDGIINDAGVIQPFVKVTDLDYEAIDHVLSVNFYGTLYVTKAFLPHLLTRPEAYIVNISSMGGFLPVPGQTIYGASKAAVKLFSEGLASELSSTSVRVMTVFPGATDTNIAENSGVELQLDMEDGRGSFRMVAPRDAAQTIIDGLELDRSQILIGMDSKFMNFATRLAPQQAARLIHSQMKALLPE